MRSNNFGVNKDVPEETRKLLLTKKIIQLVEAELVDLWQSDEEDPFGIFSVEITLVDPWHDEPDSIFYRRVINVGAREKILGI